MDFDPNLRREFERVLADAEAAGFRLIPFDGDIACPGGLWGLVCSPEQGIAMGLMHP